MEDADKIKALIIYFQHWGKDEVRAQRAADGIHETIRLLKVFCVEEDDVLADKLMHLLKHIGVSRYLWVEFADVLLNKCGGCFYGHDSEGLYFDDEEILFHIKIRLEDNLNSHNEDTVCMIYEDEFGYNDVLSVDAIVALF